MKIPSQGEFTTLTSSNLSGWNFTQYMNNSTYHDNSYAFGGNAAGFNTTVGMSVKSPVLCIKQD